MGKFVLIAVCGMSVGGSMRARTRCLGLCGDAANAKICVSNIVKCNRRRRSCAALGFDPPSEMIQAFEIAWEKQLNPPL